MLGAVGALGQIQTLEGLLGSALIYGTAVGFISPSVYAWVADLSHPEHKGRAIATMFIGLEAGICLGALWAGYSFSNDLSGKMLSFYSIGGVTILLLVFLIGWKYQGRK